MPELPEVETVRRGLSPHVVGKRLIASAHDGLPLRFPLPDLQHLHGRRLIGIDRRSKYLLFRFDGEMVLLWHLGMTGQFHALPAEDMAGRFEHVRFDFENGISLRYRDARRFGYAGLCREDEIECHPWLAQLGVEPLGDGFNVDYLCARLAGRRAPLKNLLMDASIVVGVGNIYASESLFRAGIHPASPAGKVSKGRLERLVVAVKSVLAEAIDAGGSSIRDFVRADGKPGYFAHSFAVYGREQQPCTVCGRAVRRLVQGGRSTFYCPGCQH